MSGTAGTASWSGVERLTGEEPHRTCRFDSQARASGSGMTRDQIFMGAAIALICVMGLLNDVWFLQNTRKGRWLVERFGDDRARLVLRVALLGGAVFGLLLAADVVRPLRWG